MHVKLRTRICSLALALWASAGALAQAPSAQMNDAEIEQASKKAKEQFNKITPKDLGSASKNALTLFRDGSAEKAMKSSGQTMPNMDALPTLMTVPNVDIGALASQLQQGPVGPLPQMSVEPKLIVFITMGMPAESIRGILRQAHRIGAAVVLRGMVNNSMKQTQLSIKNLLGNESIGLSVDPDAFDRYNIRRVPSFVLVKASTGYANTSACANQRCTEDDNFVTISGDVSLDYALEQIESRSRRFKAEARQFLKKIRG